MGASSCWCPGYATVPQLLNHVAARDVDAVMISHGHGVHCADLNPLLRARHLSADPPPALPVFALRGAADAVLALDGPMLTDEYALQEFEAGDDFAVGPVRVTTRALRHFVPNVGVRLEVGDVSVAYTGDGGADPAVVDLAAGRIAAPSRGHLRRTGSKKARTAISPVQAKRVSTLPRRRFDISCWRTCGRGLIRTRPQMPHAEASTVRSR